MYKYLLTELKDHTFIIRLNRPDVLNALCHQMMEELLDAVDKITTSDEIKGVLLTGAGDKAFAAGADISEFQTLTPEEAVKMSKFGQKVLFALENCPKPVIAAVNGFA